jgi:hypothetical protein
MDKSGTSEYRMHSFSLVVRLYLMYSLPTRTLLSMDNFAARLENITTADALVTQIRQWDSPLSTLSLTSLLNVQPPHLAHKLLPAIDAEQAEHLVGSDEALHQFRASFEQWYASLPPPAPDPRPRDERTMFGDTPEADCASLFHLCVLLWSYYHRGRRSVLEFFESIDYDDLPLGLWFFYHATHLHSLEVPSAGAEGEKP